ncbi:MAG: ankyrin repeat domain-containing protein [Verrucomicrobiae bacterium]|nr:ankyrin repeat domain-containing protein [Verrucomicrobiae bacterium]
METDPFRIWRRFKPKFRAKLRGSVSFRRKMLVGIVAALLLLGGGGWGVYYGLVVFRHSHLRYQIQLRQAGVPFDEQTFLVAVNAGNQPLVWTFLRAGINPDAAMADGTSALMIAAAQGHVPVVQTLVENRASLNHTNQSGQSALSMSLGARKLDISAYLKRAGATNEISILDAIRLGDRAAVEDIVFGIRQTDETGREGTGEIKADFGAQDPYGMSKMPEAEVRRIYELVNRPDGDGLPPLFWAVVTGQETVVEPLVRAGAEINHVHKRYGQTPLMLAAEKGFPKVAKILLDHRASVDFRDSKGRTALLWAVIANQPQVVSLLLAKGSDINAAESQKGMTPLQIAIVNKNRNLAEALIDAGADVRKPDFSGRAALDWAVQVDSLPIVEMLLKKKTSVYVGNPAFLLTSAKIAQKEGRTDMEKLIRSYLKK